MNNLPTAPPYLTVKSESAVLGRSRSSMLVDLPENLGKRPFGRVRSDIRCHDVEYEPYGDLIPCRIRGERCDSSSDHGHWAVRAENPSSGVGGDINRTGLYCKQIGITARENCLPDALSTTTVHPIPSLVGKSISFQ